MKEIPYRIGHGYDVHALGEGLELWLGGVRVPHTKGCIAHSDGDVAVHALCDAMLGALALGDIGQHFPDTSEEFRGIDSKILLRRVNDLIAAEGYSVANADITIAAQRPKRYRSRPRLPSISVSQAVRRELPYGPQSSSVLFKVLVVVVEADILDDVGMEAVGDRAGACCGLYEPLCLVIVFLTLGEGYVHYDAGYAAGVGSHLFLYLDSSAVNVESVGLGRRTGLICP